MDIKPAEKGFNEPRKHKLNLVLDVDYTLMKGLVSKTNK